MDMHRYAIHRPLRLKKQTEKKEDSLNIYEFMKKFQLVISQSS